LRFELGNPAASDKVNLVTGTLTIGAGVLGFDDFAFTSLAQFGNGIYTLFDTSTPISGSFDSTNLSGSFGNGVTGTLGFADGGNDVVLTVVPEPAATSFLLFGASALIMTRRSRRKS
jgi:hypothetical protein